MGAEIQKVRRISESLLKHLHGKETALQLALNSFFSRGHLLIEDLPGLGKTTLAVSVARALGLEFGRIQCTNDLLPSDITGLSIYNKNSGSFEFHPGPIFNNVILVDEINRATSKTQSALLEAMEERQVTVEGNTYELKEPFFVIATQNPIEHHGTFPLPTSQLDRFMMRINIGYPSKEAEKMIINEELEKGEQLEIEEVINKDDVLGIQEMIRGSIHVSGRIMDYILEIVEATRNSKCLISGLSTRGALAITETARTNAFFQDRDYVIPEDIKEVSVHTISHRVIFKDEFQSFEMKEIVRSIIEEVSVPV
jgi:MoxR-like ATPase